MAVGAAVVAVPLAVIAIVRTTRPTPPPVVFGYQPLWPFASAEDAAARQAAYRSNGSEAWHLDAARTAQIFTTDYLGFTEGRVRGLEVVR